MENEDFILKNVRETSFDKFHLPIEIEKDHDYYSKLCETLDNYFESINNLDYLSQSTKLDLNENIEYIKNALVHYYSGVIDKAKQCVKDVVIKYLDTPIITRINESPAFYGFVSNSTEIEPTFFRARVGRRKFIYSELLSIPNTMRELVSTQRFSIPGIPCLYLGSTSYCCWLEMDKPKDDEFNVSAVKIDGNKKILDLAFDLNTLKTITMQVQANSPKVDNLKRRYVNTVEQMIVLWPLVCATSFVNKNRTDYFRSEYIISQIVMQVIGEIPEIYGVSYLSKKSGENKSFGAFPILVNLAVPNVEYVSSYKKYNHSKKYANNFKNLTISEPFNFMDFIKFSHQLNETAKMPDKIKKKTLVTHFNVRLSVLDDEPIFYSNTYFGEFDEYLNGRINNLIDTDEMNKRN